jgi:hypothetical protein
MSSTPSQSTPTPSAALFTVTPSSNPDFDEERTGRGFRVFSHAGDTANADQTATFLEKTAFPFYQKNLGLTPSGINVYLTTTAEEYLTRAHFPGGLANIQIGDGSVPDDHIYFYRPFDDPTPGKTEEVMIHEGVHATLRQVLGPAAFATLPTFLNEGIAHYVETLFAEGKDFTPIEDVPFNDLLIQAAMTNNSPLIPLTEVEAKCAGFVADQTTNGLCRGEGVYFVWLLVKNHGPTIPRLLIESLQETLNWTQSLEAVTGTTLQIWNGRLLETIKNDAQ